MDWSPPGSSVHGIFQTRILEWVARPSPVDLPDAGIEPASLISPSLAGRFFTIVPLGKPEGVQKGGDIFFSRFCSSLFCFSRHSFIHSAIKWL